jgi:hypothetical protein
MRWVDLFVVTLTVVPFFTALSNGLGMWEGLSYTLTNAFRFLVPYAAGRIYFADEEGALDLAKAIYVGGLIYIPLILFEKVMSPQLHSIVYGSQHFDFSQTIRSGGYRPVVFMQHGLATALWMAAASVAGVALKRAGMLKSMGFWGSWPVVIGVCLAAVACVSTGALALLVVALIAYLVYRNLRTPWVLIALALIPSVYVGVRATGTLQAESVTEMSALVFNEGRVASLNTRLVNEDILAEKAWEQPVFGWGRFGRNRVEEDGKDIVITDGLWILFFGQLGLVGLISLLGMYLAPVAAVLIRSSNRLLARPEGSAIIVLCLISTMHIIDSLLNAMLNPIFVVALGTLAGNLSLSTRFLREPQTQAHDDPPALTEPQT